MENTVVIQQQITLVGMSFENQIHKAVGQARIIIGGQLAAGHGSNVAAPAAAPAIVDGVDDEIMAKLYVISLDENYPWYINPYTIFTPNLLEKWQTSN